jgi:Xaa-Pro dipeptidase
LPQGALLMDLPKTKNEITERLNRFREELATHQLDGALLVQTVDVYYLSGTDQDAHLWVPSFEKNPLLMVRKSILRAREVSAVKTIVPLPSLSHIPNLIKKHTRRLPKRLGLEMDILPAGLYLTYQKFFPETEMVDVSPLIRRVRMTKSSYEISRVKMAAQMADEMYEQVPSFLEKAETETDLALRVEAFYRGKGHPGLVRARGFNSAIYYGHILSGENSSVPSSSMGPTGGKGLGPFYSQGAGKGKIARHVPIIVDYASNVDGYIADQTRIFSLGALKEKFHRAHDAMLQVQETVSQKGKPGMRAGELYNMALQIAEKAGLIDGFMGYPDPVPFIAHGVGLEIDEWPIIGRNSTTILEKGMAIALEPKVVFPGEGVVGIENVFVVTENGMKKLNRFPDEICTC